MGGAVRIVDRRAPVAVACCTAARILDFEGRLKPGYLVLHMNVAGHTWVHHTLVHTLVVRSAGRKLGVVARSLDHHLGVVRNCSLLEKEVGPWWDRGHESAWGVG